MKKRAMKIMACMLACAAVMGTASESAAASTATAATAGVTSYTSNIVSTFNLPSAGVTRFLSEKLKIDETVSVQTEVTDNGAEVVKSEYEDIAIAQVNDFVYVRAEANAESDYVGKLYNNNSATVLETLEGWYKIQSGNVTGYVSADFVVVGDEALVKAASARIANVNTETLNVRESASTDAGIVVQVGTGNKLSVVDESVEGWVGVSTNSGTGYVSTEFVSVETVYTYAESKEEEQARLAAEEAARQEAERQAAEEAARRSARNSSSSSSSGSSSSSSSSSSKSYSAPSGTSGQAVVDYACQFVGNPYVYGGSSLTNGTDCSGYVMSVYNAFGVSLPHSSSAMRSCGYEVSQDEMKAGDIVCYSGHVGIYVGDGTIVNASTPATGIKYSNAYYKNIITVRRIFD